MEIRITNEYKIKDIIKEYKNMEDDGVFALNDKLEVRPAYQRNFVYSPEQSSAVIDSILHNYPIGLMYWATKENSDELECLDGQQRIISICEFTKNKILVNVDGNPKNYEALKEENPELIEKFLNYDKMTIAICDGTLSEKKAWFERINTAGEPLEKQEIRNAIYCSPWTTTLKKYFSTDKCVAYHKTSKNYGNIFGDKTHGRTTDRKRQDWLETIIKWKCEFDGMDVSNDENIDKSICEYMVRHQSSEFASAMDIIGYFDNLVSWIKSNFEWKPIMEKVDWGKLYNKYHDTYLKKVETNNMIEQLLLNAKADGISNPKGIYEYVFDGEFKHLSDRIFPDKIKRQKWDEQNHKCAMCHNEFDYEEMNGDHIVPWSRGGTTTEANCQMLCIGCNSTKKARMTSEAKELAQRLKIEIDEN